MNKQGNGVRSRTTVKCGQCCETWIAYYFKLGNDDYFGYFFRIYEGRYSGQANLLAAMTTLMHVLSEPNSSLCSLMLLHVRNFVVAAMSTLCCSLTLCLHWSTFNVQSASCIDIVPSVTSLHYFFND